MTNYLFLEQIVLRLFSRAILIKSIKRNDKNSHITVIASDKILLYKNS